MTCKEPLLKLGWPCFNYFPQILHDSRKSLVYQSWLQKFLFYGKSWQKVPLWQESQKRSMLMIQIMKQTFSFIYYFFPWNFGVPRYFLRFLEINRNVEWSGDVDFFLFCFLFFVSFFCFLFYTYSNIDTFKRKKFAVTR